MDKKIIEASQNDRKNSDLQPISKIMLTFILGLLCILIVVIIFKVGRDMILTNTMKEIESGKKIKYEYIDSFGNIGFSSKCEIPMLSSSLICYLDNGIVEVKEFKLIDSQ